METIRGKETKMKKTVIALAAMAALALPAMAAANGAAVYKAKCAMCHGADGSKANAAMGIKPLSSAEVQKQSDAQLIETVTKGKAKMPAYGSRMSADEIKAAVSFIRTLKK